MVKRYSGNSAGGLTTERHMKLLKEQRAAKKKPRR